MINVIFSGWREGLLKISLLQLIRDKSGLSLTISKEYVDSLLNGHTFSIQVPTIEDAKELVEKANEMGAECFLESNVK